MTTAKLRPTLILASASLAAMVATGATAQEVTIYQPGAPGTEGRAIDAEAASKLADTRYSPADVAFMQGMIHHHHQAVVMADMVEARTNRPELREAAGRIKASQNDEIEFMQDWLTTRGEDAPDPTKGHPQHIHHTMEGMASAEDLNTLASLSGVDFDEKFLRLMIAHHEGALDMVDKLLGTSGTARDPAMFSFAGDVKNDQKAEIDRMIDILSSLSTDPRVNLAAGVFDAGQAAMNMELVAELRKPAGFYDPANPGGLRPVIEDEDDGDESDAEENEDAEPQFGSRGAWLSFGNTDMAFSGDMLIAGNYHGFNIYKLDAKGMPNLYSSVVCPGGQGDVSIVGNLLITSVEDERGRKDCGLQGIDEDVSDERHRGLRIFDISDLKRPRQVGLVQTCRGSHTHSIVSADETSIIVYNSGTAGVRDEEELEGCIGNVAGDERTALFSIDVIEIPLADPSKARIIDSPRVFADEETGNIAGLWRGGDHGDGTQTTSTTNQCHDITVFPSLALAGGACSGNGIIFDISDPRKPKRIDAVTDTGFAYWHSATFNNEGTKVVFTDEWGGGGMPRCRASDPLNWGANAIYDVVDGELQFRSNYKMAAPQTDKENCVAHNGSIVPVPGRDLFIQAWYQGGISLMDFTDSANPKEIAFFDRGPVSDEQFGFGGYWSVYYYKGKIYGTEITRGLDVFELLPSEYLSAEEIAAAKAAVYPDDVFNPQTQTTVTWPQDVLDRLEASRQGG
ncbi:DUF305 domain-containing protein [Altererythrobacter sp. MF3-039]|uniref:DUF305 domain-containing protein n=1 Tax=Altererythrobacter sp. MF3-039 TaxID=3252901 RepID=UPI00390C414D